MYNKMDNIHKADKIYRQFEDAETLRYEGFQPRPQGGGFPLYTSLLTGSTIAVPVPCDKDGMPTVSDVEIGELVGLRHFVHLKEFGIAECKEV